MLCSRKSSFNLNLRLGLSGLITTVIPGTERSLIAHKKPWCVLKSLHGILHFEIKCNEKNFGKGKKLEETKKPSIKQKNNRQVAIKVWMRESRRRRLHLDGGSVLAREGKIKRTGGVLFSQRSLAAGSALLRTRCLRMHVCVSLSVWYTCLSDICLCIRVCL